MKIQYISEDKLKQLEESISFISNLLPENDVLYVVGNSIEKSDRNLDKTNMLQRLVILNQERKELIENLKQ